ncbi:AAA family ATPase [Alphaproteobacteria bacterium KMM 3653]|uniref:AAA family ATPase n=1 Tax=Harenicola maris TaxID=2841044 RepID=A0AAP2CK86_9RHOB|nr:AAA family ATPase [Harenicola maris]
MTSNAALQPEPAPITACTVARDVQNFDLLIEDMETELGESWGDLNFADAMIFMGQPDASALEFIAVAIDAEDEKNLPEISRVITTAKAQDIRVILIAEEVKPMALHQLMRDGAADFVPYPLPEGALHEAIERMRRPAEPAPAAAPQVPQAAGSDLNGVVLATHGMAGGTGSTTFAVNLAWELATITKTDAPRVCLLDLDFQFGSTATFLDLARKEAVFELLSDTERLDSASFMAALQTFNDKLHVLTAPYEMLPLDIVGPEDIEKIIEVARANFDFVIIDMPSTLVTWSEVVLNAAQIYFATIELDMRSAQNTLRFVRALKAEDLPYEKLRFALNRAPKFTDISGKNRVKRMAESLDIDIELLLPDGAKAVMQACDHGLPMAETAAKNPLRKEIHKLAKQMHDLVREAETAN